jgi:dimethylargininase
MQANSPIHQITKSRNHIMLLAFTRSVPASIHHCELTHLSREPIDPARAIAEHAQYEAALERLGCRVQRLPDAPELPDSVFVEDTAVVFDEVAIIARPGAASRRAEVEAMVKALTPYRKLASIEAPGTLDGGDVLVTPGRVFIGVSGRTNAEGVRQFAAHLAPFGYETIAVPVTGCLHLKSAVSLARLPPALDAARTLLVINRDWVDAQYFEGFDFVDVDASEPAAANVLRIGEQVICAAEHARTRARLEAQGIRTITVPAGELAKAEGGVTCCSVLVRVSS